MRPRCLADVCVLKAHLSRNQSDREAFNNIDNIPGGSDDRVVVRKTLAWGRVMSLKWSNLSRRPPAVLHDPGA